MLMLLLALAQDAGAAPSPNRADAMMTSYRTRTRADVQCRRNENDDEIVVCSLRDADKYRVPLVPAANARNSVPLRTSDLTRDYNHLPCGQGAIIARCGPGFGMTVSTDGRGVKLVERPIAP
ncbi:hypothetical protein [Sphingomonas sp.]|uniref:hypothetical protein n=1 Tax=Sphingomonas sp. TaxID=28214 RepID=UPI001AFE527E|nr:hypothetical protein [Sphingomonas sp.]MBO9714445.1 hypothetical protein [Sphingomonas sp.]